MLASIGSIFGLLSGLTRPGRALGQSGLVEIVALSRGVVVEAFHPYSQSYVDGVKLYWLFGKGVYVSWYLYLNANLVH